MTDGPGGAATAPSARLRADTAAVHRHVESLLDVQSTTNDLGRYGDHLERLWSAVAKVERAVVRCGGWKALDLTPSRGRPRLRSDLIALGRTPPDPPSWSLPAGQAPGAIYVLEGSALGGGLVGGLVAESLPQAPRSFLRAADAGRWRTVRAALDRLPPAGYRSMLSGARRAFDVFAVALEDASPWRPGETFGGEGTFGGGGTGNAGDWS